MRSLILLCTMLIVAFPGTHTFAQGPDTLWTRTFGGSGTDVGYSVDITSDFGYIITGWTESYGWGGWDVYLVKTDYLGDTLWTETFGGYETDGGTSVQQTSDGGYIIAGYTESYDTAGDAYIIKTDASGDEQWSTNYNYPDVSEEAKSVIQGSDGHYYVAGFQLRDSRIALCRPGQR